jgi:hypothetical protein
MKCRLASLCVALPLLASFVYVSAAASPGAFQTADSPRIGLVDEVKELFPDTRLKEPLKRLTVHAPRNSTAAVHVMITGLHAGQPVQFAVSGKDGKPVDENTGLDRNTEKYSGKINPYVIRRAPFRVYDPLLPVTSPVVGDSSLALRLEVPIDSSAVPGEHQYLPAGDSHILYPIHDGPLSSHRFEAHRIGIEDHELLSMVKAHNPAKADRIIGTVVQGFDKYTADVDAYRKARQALLEAADEATSR